VIVDPEAAQLSPADRALAGLCNVMAEAPWTIDRGDLERLHAAGLGDDEIVHAVVLSAYFNYLNRVADGIDLDWDYTSPLPRYDKQVERAAVPRPPQAEWPAGGGLGLSIGVRPASAAAVPVWRRLVMEREGGIGVERRAIVARAAAAALCDRSGSGSEPVNVSVNVHVNDPEPALRELSRKLTLTPWAMTENDVASLRRIGLDDRAILDVVTTTAHQNAVSRLSLLLLDV
jgi:alkylhydroperoxidase family enzyme